MARHRNFQGSAWDDHDDGLDDYDEDDHYGYEEQCLSPTSSQYIFHRDVTTAQASAQQRFAYPAEGQYREHEDYGDGDSMFEMDDVLETKKKVVKEKPPKQKATQSNGKVVDATKPKQSASKSTAVVTTKVSNLSLQDKKNDSSAKNPRSVSSPSPNRSDKELRISSPPLVTPKIRNRQRPAGGKSAINLIVIGHVDAGKSTLMGHLLLQLGKVNQKTMHKYKQESQKLGKASFAFAWVLDESSEERSRGVTMDIAKTRFETANRQIVLLDAPGHKDFIPNMISGATQADAAILVANATRGEFETGFDLGGQTREHTMLVRSLGVSQLTVVVNKLDTVDWSESRYEEVKAMLQQFLKQTGFSKVDFVPVSGLAGINLTEKPGPGHPLTAWYKGPTLVEAIDSFAPPVKLTDKALRLCISNVYKGLTGNITVEGKVETGSIEAGDKIVIMPNGETAQVKSVQGDEGFESQIGFAGDQCLVTLSGNCDLTNVSPGHVMCHTDAPASVTQKLEARIVLFNVSVPLIPGFAVRVYYKACIYL